MTTRGIEDFYLFEGSIRVNGEVFFEFVQRCLLGIMLPFDGDNDRSVLMMDNAAIHHVEAVVDMVAAAVILFRFCHPIAQISTP